MTHFRKKPVVITAITFDELVAHGIATGGNVVNGMPWSFSYAGHAITHENDDCYLIPTLEGTMQMGRDDMLITGVKGEIYPCKREIFAATYEAAPTALPVIDLGPDSLEREIKAKASNGPRVTPADIEANIASEHFFTAEQGAFAAFDPPRGSDVVPPELSLLTFCVLVLRNGAKVVGINYGAIDPAQHSAERGRQEARAQAVDKVYELLGFRLRDELARPALTEGDVAADLAGTCRPDNHTSACTACKRA